MLAQVREGLYYNPYFTGGAIAMPKMLADGGVEYDDGTIATESQQAKVLSITSYYGRVVPWRGNVGTAPAHRCTSCVQQAHAHFSTAA